MEKVNLKNPHRPTKEVFEAQEGYINRLIELGRLPSPDSFNSLDERHTQAFIRETMGFLMEEIGESESALDLIYERAEDNDYEGAVLAVKDYNEEVADVMAFFFELFFYTGLTKHAIFDALSMASNHLNLGEVRHRDDLISQAIEMGNYGFQKEVGSSSWEITSHHFKLPEEDYLTNGARILGNINLTFHKSCIYDCFVRLTTALNCLKNKPWKAYDTDTDLGKFELSLSFAFLEFMASLSCLKFRASQLSRMVIHKVKINHNRLDEEKEQKGYRSQAK